MSDPLAPRHMIDGKPTTPAAKVAGCHECRFMSAGEVCTEARNLNYAKRVVAIKECVRWR